MYWFAGIGMCLIITFIMWGRSQDPNHSSVCKKLDDLAEFCDAAVANVGYCELKRDRKQILEFIGDGEIIKQPLAVYMLNDTIKRVDAKLAGFSDEEKQIYDAVYGETTVFKAVEKFPKDLKSDDSLWAQFFKLFNAESITGQGHAESLEFYRKHRAQMENAA